MKLHKWHEPCSYKLEDWRLDHRGIEISYLRPEDASRCWWQTQRRRRQWRSPTATTTPTIFELHGRLKSLMLLTTEAAARSETTTVTLCCDFSLQSLI